MEQAEPPWRGWSDTASASTKLLFLAYLLGLVRSPFPFLLPKLLQMTGWAGKLLGKPLWAGAIPAELVLSAQF